jgi:hypothetical protein
LSKIEVNTVEPQCGTTLTLGASGDTVQLGSGASQSGFGRSGSVDWQTTPKTSTFTAADGEGYFINSSSPITANLPAGAAGAIVAFSDYARNFNTHNFTISPNGSEKIGGVAADLILDVNGQAVTLVYVDSTKGWINVQNAEDTETGVTPAFVTATGGNTVTTVCTNFKVHTFTSPGTFCVSCAGNALGSNEVSYMVVAAGGGGGGRDGGGGGAGGFREAKSPSTPYTASPLDGYSTPANRITISATAFPVGVGGGGAGGVGCSTSGGCGANSNFGPITSAGGGGGGSFVTPNTPALIDGKDGGSGGGGGITGSPGGVHAGGTGNTPSVTPAQGTDGGDGFSQGGAALYPNGAVPGGGGGGAGAAGQDYNTPGSNATGSAGGAGVTSSINGSPVTRAGGGGGGAYSGSPKTLPGGAAGSGGGGAGVGCNVSPTVGGAGTANTGGGGGGGGDGVPGPSTSGGQGGSGIVIIRYKFQ